MEIANSMQSKIILSIFALETDMEMESPGVSSTGLASLVNRITFRENKKILADKKLIKGISKQAGKREFTYYKTTTLGQVLAIKSLILKNDDAHVDASKYPRDDPDKVFRLSSKFLIDPEIVMGELLDDGTIHETEFTSTNILQYFYQKLPRLKKYSRRNKQFTQLEKESLKFAFFDLQINPRSTYGEPHKIPIKNIIMDTFTSKRTRRLTKTEITDYVESVIKHGITTPIIINSKQVLIDGGRRLDAARESGQSKIDAIEIIDEYGIEVNFKMESRTRQIPPMEARLIKYFRTDDDSIKKMYDYILDSLTFIFLRNLETMQEGNVGVGRAHVEKILNDPDLKSFYQQYKTERQQDLRKSLNFLSDDN